MLIIQLVMLLTRLNALFFKVVGINLTIFFCFMYVNVCSTFHGKIVFIELRKAF